MLLFAETKEFMLCPATGDPIKSHSSLPSSATYLLYIIFPLDDPCTIKDANSLALEFKVIVPLFTKFPDNVRSLSRLIVRAAEVLTVMFLATAPEFEIIG